ncbi:RadC family protein [Chitinophaga sancti]|uniref:DNA repair protein RadC n=1 Tax=Chitinophaga sancti TaxID=1004 RepID=A0A1K1Q7E9_9BACT|nr:DNA repair protein RadC [Chitinophaga sancti]WQD61214.1 DNA repair protein RadC [Chitinophaga sancti]WQG86659.1 DNA repair protein RadC [Chitinophaga sancti]SFW55906.1 DNA repair protein RadC [Chitinophaga sancti]
MDTIDSLARYVPINKWRTDDQPRQKLVIKGIETLSDAELLALLLNTGHKHKSALLLAQEILSKSSNNLQELGKVNVNQLRRLRGIGEAKAARIVAALELGRRRQAGNVLFKNTIHNGQDAALYFKPILGDCPNERVHVLFLNFAHKVIKDCCISQGGISSAFADVRIILREALELGATSIILCHNHPSGNLNPSQSDILFTKKVVQAASILDILVLDHIIVSQAGYYSMNEEGLMSEEKQQRSQIRENNSPFGFAAIRMVIA